MTTTKFNLYKCNYCGGCHSSENCREMEQWAKDETDLHESYSIKNLNCPICSSEKLQSHNKPIQWWGCKNCKEVFVIDENGQLDILENVEYKN